MPSKSNASSGRAPHHGGERRLAVRGEQVSHRRISRLVALHARLDALAQAPASGIGQHAAGPAVDVELAHRHAQAGHALALLGRRHRGGAVQRVGGFLDVVRVDDQRLGHLARGAGEAAQDQHALLVVARGDELLADQVHAVVQAGHHADVGGAVQLVDRLVLVVLRPAGAPAGSRRVPKRWLMRVGDAAAMRSWKLRYSSSELRVGAATCTKTKRPIHSGCFSSRRSTACSRSRMPLV